ncbi:MAG: ABC transporter substrate-binding protein [Burkholderiales bacterium]
MRTLVCILLACVAGAASAQTAIRFTSDWRVEGPSVFFLLPLYKGYFKDEGLDVTFDVGVGSAAAIQRIASGAYDVGSGDMTALIEYYGNNPGTQAMQAVYLLYESNPSAVFFWKKLNIKTPKDLEGKRFATSVFDAVYRAFPLVLSANGMQDGSVRWLVGDPQIKETLMAKGDAEGLTAFYATGLLNLRARGVNLNEVGWFKLADLGVRNLYGNAILVSTKLIKENPKAVAGFVRAFNKGFKDVVQNPDAAIQYAKRREPLIDEALELERLKFALEDISNAAHREAGYGTIRKDKLERQIEDVNRAFKPKTKPSADAIVNASFLPPIAERR